MTSPTTETNVQPNNRKDDRKGTAALGRLSLPRLYLLRFGYLVMAVGISVKKWPLIANHDGPWPLFEGVETCMLVALSLLAFLGLRYPVKMLPILLFEIGWESIWAAIVVLPLWINDQLDQATANVFYTCLVVLIVVAVVPWRYVVRQYVVKKGDPWRRDAARPVGDKL